MKDVFKKFSHLAAGRVLDAATGRGDFIKFIKQNFASYEQIIGVDASDAAVQQAQKLFPENDIEIYRMNLESLNYADNYFDTVCISNSLHHLESPQKVFAELLRVLKPGGRLIVVEMYKDGKQNQAQQTHIMMHHWISQIDRQNGIFHRETYTKDEIRELVRALPIKDIEIEDYYIPVDNPKEAADLEPMIKNVKDMMKRCETSELSEQLCAEGKALLERMPKIGFMSASKLMISAIKI